MAKIGQLVTIPTGSYCTITLDSGEKLIINHDEGPPGLSGGARATLAELTKEKTPAASASPLGAFVAHIQRCASVGEAVARCPQLIQGE